MRGTTRLLIVFGIVFVVVGGAITFIITRMTSSMIGSASRTRDPGALMSSIGDTIVWTVVPVVAITVVGLVVFFVFVRRIMGADKRLVASGIPGTAIVLAVRDTGTTINNVNAVLDVRLQVTLPGHAPYETQSEVTLGRMSWGALQPGMTVAVKVDPKDPRRVAIDWNAGGQSSMPGGMAGAVAAALGQAGFARAQGAAPQGNLGPPGMVVTPGGNFQVPGVAGAMQAKTVRSADDIVAQGERGEGTIQAVSHTGATAAQMAPGAALDSEKADDPMVYIAMQVQPRNGAAFAAQGIYRVPKRKLTALAIGRRVPVAYLAGQPETATIDWSRM